MTHDTDDFWSMVNNDINKAAYASMGRRAVVSAVEGFKIRLQDIRGEPLGVAPSVAFERLEAGDHVWIEPVGRMIHGAVTKFLAWVVVGKINDSTTKLLEGSSLILTSGMDLAGSMNADGSSPIWTIDTATGDAVLGNITAKSSNVFFAFGDSQTTTDDGPTTSTTTWSNAMTATPLLPAGTWTITAFAACGFLHSASGRVHFRMDIGSNATGDQNSPSAPSASPNYRSAFVTHSISNYVGGGTVNVRAQFKSLDAGTTTPNNPIVWGTARRTA